MVEKVEIKEEPTGAEAPDETVNKPEGIPEKFGGDVNKLVEAYKELEAKQGEAIEEKAEGDTEGDQKTDEDSGEKFTVGGVDMTDYSNEFKENGKLSDETYKSLQEQHGYTKPVIDAYIKGLVTAQQETIDVTTSAHFDPVGGQDNYDKMIDWASANLSTQDKQVFNKINDAGDPDAIRLNVANMYSRYEKANGKTPNLLKGGTAPKGGDIYESTAQLTRDMSKPEYKLDPAFRAKVEARLKRSSII